MEKKIPVLFAMPKSVYNTFPECDVYDEKRDAYTYPGGAPVIAHPPCRLWSRMRRFSTAPEIEKQTAWFALEMVRRYGGVLEHPADSSFWKAAGLPTGYQKDQYGGFTLVLDQHAFGHRARKRTWLYIVGVHPRDIPHTKERNATPPLFAKFLIAIIHEIHRNNNHRHQAKAEAPATGAF